MEIKQQTPFELLKNDIKSMLHKQLEQSSNNPLINKERIMETLENINEYTIQYLFGMVNAYISETLYYSEESAKRFIPFERKKYEYDDIDFSIFSDKQQIEWLKATFPGETQQFYEEKVESNRSNNSWKLANLEKFFDNYGFDIYSLKEEILKIPLLEYKSNPLQREFNRISNPNLEHTNILKKINEHFKCPIKIPTSNYIYDLLKKIGLDYSNNNEFTFDKILSFEEMVINALNKGISIKKIFNLLCELEIIRYNFYSGILPSSFEFTSIEEQLEEILHFPFTTYNQEYYYKFKQLYSMRDLLPENVFSQIDKNEQLFKKDELKGDDKMDNWNNMYMPGDKGNNNLQGKTNTISPLNYDSVNQPTEQKTEFGKGTSFYTCDGREVSSMEEVIMYNQIYYERMKNQIQPDLEKPSGMHR